MSKYYILIIALFVAGILGTLAYFSYQNSQLTSSTKDNRGVDLRYDESDEDRSNSSTDDKRANSVVSLNTKELAYGQFDGFDESNVYLSTDDGRVSLPLSPTTYRIICTAQNLSSIRSVDFDQKTKSKRADTKDMVALLKNGETVVLFSNEDDNGVFVNHTVILEDSNCPI